MKTTLGAVLTPAVAPAEAAASPVGQNAVHSEVEALGNIRPYGFWGMSERPHLLEGSVAPPAECAGGAVAGGVGCAPGALAGGLSGAVGGAITAGVGHPID
ncbi:hypothetical protein ACEN19_07330 [Corynebacterium auriscanis]|uniref:hypothetical protein n=1 Tax=Corynebacterium auriscanis TaxID=99807 RepID=UPI003CE7511B